MEGNSQTMHAPHSEQNRDNDTVQLRSLLCVAQGQLHWRRGLVVSSHQTLTKQKSVLPHAHAQLKEQEIRSITWIAECIAQGVRDRIGDFVNV